MLFINILQSDLVPPHNRLKLELHRMNLLAMRYNRTHLRIAIRIMIIRGRIILIIDIITRRLTRSKSRIVTRIGIKIYATCITWMYIIVVIIRKRENLDSRFGEFGLVMLRLFLGCLFLWLLCIGFILFLLWFVVEGCWLDFFFGYYSRWFTWYLFRLSSYILIIEFHNKLFLVFIINILTSSLSFFYQLVYMDSFIRLFTIKKYILFCFGVKVHSLSSLMVDLYCYSNFYGYCSGYLWTSSEDNLDMEVVDSILVEVSLVFGMRYSSDQGL